MKLDTGVERDELESLFASEADGVVQTGELFAHPLDDTRQDALLLLLEEGNLTAQLHISLLVFWLFVGRKTMYKTKGANF